MIDRLIGWLTSAGKVAELAGSLIAAVLGIVAVLSNHPMGGAGKVAVASAFVAGVGHTVSHHSPVGPDRSPPTS